MIGLTFRRIRKWITMIPFFTILMNPCVSLGNDDITRGFQKLMDQYQSINTVRVKSQMLIKAYVGRVQDPPSDNTTTRQNHYEYWANKQGHYRVNSFYDSNEEPEAFDFAYDGNLFQVFDKQASLFSYGKKDPKQNPLAQENPLFAPLLFLGQNDDNCRACTLKLADVMNVKTWEKKTVNARVVTASDHTPGQIVTEIPGGVMDGKEFVFHVYFGDNPDYLPSKINCVDTEGDVFFSTEITAYKAIDLNGKQTYWPKFVHHSGMDAQGNILVELYAEIEVCQINGDLPPDIFTIDFSSAKAIWDNDAEVFVREKGDVGQK